MFEVCRGCWRPMSGAECHHCKKVRDEEIAAHSLDMERRKLMLSEGERELVAISKEWVAVGNAGLSGRFGAKDRKNREYEAISKIERSYGGNV